MAKSNEKKRDFFWLSYSDLMTSLFFVMLVLFILVYTMQNEIIGKYESVYQVDKQMSLLKKNKKFIYIESCKKFVFKDLMGKEIFMPNEIQIRREYEATTIRAGREIESFLRELQKKSKKMSFILLIEGNMANFYDKRISPNNDNGFRLSYQRALAVYNLWSLNGINLRKYNTEVIISGSGFNGLCRDKIEENNKRFSIQIFPKVGSINQK